MRSRGFTLIEMLLAVAIFSFIGMASYSVLSTVLNADELSKDRLNRLNELQRTFMIIERDMLQVSQRRIRSSGNSTEARVFAGAQYLFDSEQDGVAFTRVGWRNPQLMLPRSDVQSVAYRLYEGRIERLFFVFPDPISGEEPKIMPLMEDVNELRFEYFSNNEWKKSWSETGVPQAIAVYIDTDDYGVVRRLFMLPTMNKVSDTSGEAGTGA